MDGNRTKNSSALDCITFNNFNDVALWAGVFILDYLYKYWGVSLPFHDERAGPGGRNVVPGFHFPNLIFNYMMKNKAWDRSHQNSPGNDL